MSANAKDGQTDPTGVSTERREPERPHPEGLGPEAKRKRIDDETRADELTPRLNRDVDLSVGARGFLVSCGFRREISATRESVDLIEAHCAVRPKENQVRVQPCRTGASGLLFLRLLDDDVDPVQTATAIAAAAQKPRFVKRVVPIETTCACDTLETVSNGVRELVRRHFGPPAESQRVAVAINTRGSLSVARNELIELLMKLVNEGREKASELNSQRPHRVDLCNPDRVLLCEVLPAKVFGMSVVCHGGSRSSILEVPKSGIRVRSLDR